MNATGAKRPYLLGYMLGAQYTVFYINEWVNSILGFVLLTFPCHYCLGRPGNFFCYFGHCLIHCLPLSFESFPYFFWISPKGEPEIRALGVGSLFGRWSLRSRGNTESDPRDKEGPCLGCWCGQWALNSTWSFWDNMPSKIWRVEH